MAELRHVIPSMSDVWEGEYTGEEREQAIDTLEALRSLASDRGLTIRERDFAAEYGNPSDGIPQWVSVKGPLDQMLYVCSHSRVNRYDWEKGQPVGLRATSRSEIERMKANGWTFSYDPKEVGE